MSNKLDKSKPFAQVFGDTQGRHYEQDEKFFTTDGKPWRDPNAKESAADKKAREEAEAAETQRLADESEALKKSGDDGQLGQQLGA